MPMPLRTLSGIELLNVVADIRFVPQAISFDSHISWSSDIEVIYFSAISLRKRF